MLVKYIYTGQRNSFTDGLLDTLVQVQKMLAKRPPYRDHSPLLVEEYWMGQRTLVDWVGNRGGL